MQREVKFLAQGQNVSPGFESITLLTLLAETYDPSFHQMIIYSYRELILGALL